MDTLVDVELIESRTQLITSKGSITCLCTSTDESTIGSRDVGVSTEAITVISGKLWIKSPVHGLRNVHYESDFVLFAKIRLK